MIVTPTIMDMDHLTFLLNGMEWNNVFLIFVSFHISTSYKNN
jgi:hypothetical protein